MSLISAFIALPIIIIGALVLAFRVDFIGGSSHSTAHRSAEREASRRTPTHKINR